MGKNIESIYFQHFNPFLLIIFMANYPFENIDVYCFEGGGKYQKVCFVHLIKC